MTTPPYTHTHTGQGGSRPIVLVALDGSSAAATALPVARLVAERLGAELVLLHVVSAPAAAGGLAAGDRDSGLRQHPGRELAGVHAAPVRVLVGDPATEILRSAADPQVALVVLTTHGRMPEFGRALGHVAAAVVAKTERPVMLIRPEAALAPGARLPALHRFLVPLDGTPTTARVLPPITALARRLGVALDFLLVMATDGRRAEEPGSIGAPCYVDQPQHEWPAWQREAFGRLCTVCAKCPADVPARLFLALGPIGEEILRAATDHAADAIVLVRRSQMEPGHGAVIRLVLARTPCPILLIGGTPVPPRRRTRTGRTSPGHAYHG